MFLQVYKKQKKSHDDMKILKELPLSSLAAQSCSLSDAPVDVFQEDSEITFGGWKSLKPQCTFCLVLILLCKNKQTLGGIL